MKDPVTKDDFIRMYQLSGGSTEGGEQMWAIKCRDKAAPEMLAALKKLVEACDWSGGPPDITIEEALLLAQAAIAKAEGR